MSAEGRRNGEALVRFETNEQRELAFNDNFHSQIAVIEMRLVMRLETNLVYSPIINS